MLRLYSIGNICETLQHCWEEIERGKPKYSEKTLF